MTKFYREQKVEMFYFTDPLCYHCWDFEPYLNKILQLYDNYVDLHILMGRPPEPIQEGSSSQDDEDHRGEQQLAAKVFRVFSFLDPEESPLFLRILRQSAFVEKLDLCDEQTLIQLVDSLGGPGSEVLERAKGDEGTKRLEEDLRLSKRFGVIKIPTMVLVHGGKIIKLEGIPQEEDIRRELIALLGQKPQRSPLRSLEEELRAMKRLYFRDLEILYNLNPEERIDYVEGSLEEGSYQWVQCPDGECYLEAK